MSQKIKKIILVKAQNKEKINAVIEKAEGKASARTISAQDIFKTCAYIEKYFSIPKSRLESCLFEVDLWAQNFAKAYKYSALSTQFTLIYKNRCWRVSDIRRDYTRPSNHDYEAVLTDSAKEAILKKHTVFADCKKQKTTSKNLKHLSKHLQT